MLLANEHSGTVRVMAIAETGKLTPTGQVVEGLPAALCLVFVEREAAAL